MILERTLKMTTITSRMRAANIMADSYRGTDAISP